MDGAGEVPSLSGEDGLQTELVSAHGNELPPRPQET